MRQPLDQIVVQFYVRAARRANHYVLRALREGRPRVAALYRDDGKAEMAMARARV